MKLATRTAPATWPDWKNDPRLEEPARAVANATAAIAAAKTQLDIDASLFISINADLANAVDERQASTLEDKRQAVVLAEAESKNRLERAERALERATRLHGPMEVAAMRACADDLRDLYVAQVRKVAAALETVKAEAAALDALDDHVRATLPEQEYPSSTGVATGILRRDVAGAWNEPPLLSLPGLISKIVGRSGQSIEQFAARLRQWNLL